MTIHENSFLILNVEMTVDIDILCVDSLEMMSNAGLMLNILVGLINKKSDKRRIIELIKSIEADLEVVSVNLLDIDDALNSMIAHIFSVERRPPSPVKTAVVVDKVTGKKSVRLTFAQLKGRYRRFNRKLGKYIVLKEVLQKKLANKPLSLSEEKRFHKGTSTTRTAPRRGPHMQALLSQFDN